MNQDSTSTQKQDQQRKGFEQGNGNNSTTAEKSQNSTGTNSGNAQSSPGQENSNSGNAQGSSGEGNTNKMKGQDQSSVNDDEDKDRKGTNTDSKKTNP